MEFSMHHNPWNYLFLSFLLFSSFTVIFGVDSSVSSNPFNPKASFIRYWNKQLHTEIPNNHFLLSKVSPLTAADSATFFKLAAENNLASRLTSFCSSAKLFCFPELPQSLNKSSKGVEFAVYNDRNFTEYGIDTFSGADNFKNYSENGNIIASMFHRYSHESTDHEEKFSNYASGSNIADQTFRTYGNAATGGAGEFNNYNNEVNVPNLKFASYSIESNGHGETFKGYAENANSGLDKFSNYGKHGNGIPNEFSRYGKGSNVMNSDFTSYGKTGNAARDTFTSYAFDANNPLNNFKRYGERGNGAADTFSSYREKSNVGESNFQSYAKNSNTAQVDFNNYAKSFNEGAENFTSYGKGAAGQNIGFTIYGKNTTFNEYAEDGITFSKYNRSDTRGIDSGSDVINRWVEPGKFFREKMLKQGTVMPMPDIKDKMPKRSFLPRNILSKIPFSSSKISELKRTFHAGDNSSLETIMVDALNECERAPSPGETKRCVGSAEDMLDFATYVLGRKVNARTTQNVNGSKTDIKIGSVMKINGGNVTKSVSCHQSLYPYLLYYCHSVPKVRVYEADILDPNSMEKINHGVAICHVDTSSWSSGHGAFLALGSGPGLIEVCHWIFENDMTWTIADS